MAIKFRWVCITDIPGLQRARCPAHCLPTVRVGEDVEKYKTKVSRATGSLSVQLLRRSC